VRVPAVGVDVDVSIEGSPTSATVCPQGPAEELWNDEISEPAAGDWPVIEVDMNAPADLTDLVDRVRRAMTP